MSANMRNLSDEEKAQADKEKAPTKGLIEVSVIPPGTVVFFKSGENSVTKSFVEIMNIKPNADSKLIVRYGLNNHAYSKLDDQLFFTAEEAFKD